MANILEHIGMKTRVSCGGGDAEIPTTDAEKLRALVRSVLLNADRVTLDALVHRAYRLGNESCHRAMALDATSEQPLSMHEVERRAFEYTYDFYRGDVRKMASALGIGRTTAYRKLREYGIMAPAYRSCPNCGFDLRTFQVRKV